ncbi:MAG TPA: sigma-70 family RNA polymerase sigma factor [Gemmataceae bacterium]
MSSSTLGLFLRHMALTEEVSRLGTVGDHNLLAAYESGRGQAAFAELMRRHGPMVLRTCRRVLGRGPDAEDAFQATFVLLARKASSISKREALGGWLHRVAYRTAINVLTGLTRRRVHERQAGAMSHPDPDPSTEATWNEVLPILDAELDALPEEARRLLIACYLQGKTHAEAAAELGLPLGSLARRLEKARTLLAARLARRGITVSATLLAVLLGEMASGAGVPAVLLVHTMEAAGTFTEQAPGMMSNPVNRLVKGGLAQMTKGSTHLSVALVGWVGLLGAGLIACQTLKAWPDKTPESEPTASERPAQERDKPIRTDRYGDSLPPGALARLGTLRLRHGTGVHSLEFTRDGKGLITAGRWEPIRFWDTITGRMLRQFGDDRDDRVYAAALSPDGRTLVGRVAVSDLCLWDAATGTVLRRLEAGQAGRFTSLAFSPDGKTVASGDGMALRLWEISTGKELWVENRLPIAFLAFSADGKTLAWASRRGGLHLVDAATGRELRHWDAENKRPITALVRAPNGRFLAAYGSLSEAVGGLARLWDAATGKEVRQLAADEAGIAAAALSSDGKVLATGNNRGAIRLWDAATGKELRRCAGSRSVQCLAFAPDGKTLASGSGALGVTRDLTVHLWDVQSGREINCAGEGHQTGICSIMFTPDGQDIVSSSWDGSIRVWDADAGKQRRQLLPVGDELLHGSSTGDIASTVSPDGKTFLSVASNQTESNFSVKVRRWDRESSRELRGWFQEFATRLPHALAISPDGKTVVCTVLSAAPGQGYLWETATGKELSRIAGFYPAFSQDGKLLATASPPGQPDAPATFTLWEAATGKELCSVPSPEGQVLRLLFSPDGRMLATANYGEDKQQNAILLWPLLRDESQKSRVRVGPPRLLAKGALPARVGIWTFSPDGRTLALVGETGTVRLLETATGKERGHFTGHGGEVTALSFAPDGRRLASGSRDTTILVWDATGWLRKGELRPTRLSGAEMEKLWADLAADDARLAGRAIWTLAAAPTRTVSYLAEHLRTSTADAKAHRAAQLAKVPQLLRDLDDDVFAVRQKAKAELARLGEAAESALRQALAKSPSVETRRSLEELLKTVEANYQAPRGELLRGVRVVEVLEQIGTREARQALKTLMDDAPAEFALTQEVHAALERLERAERR